MICGSRVLWDDPSLPLRFRSGTGGRSRPRATYSDRRACRRHYRSDREGAQATVDAIASFGEGMPCRAISQTRRRSRRYSLRARRSSRRNGGASLVRVKLPPSNVTPQSKRDSPSAPRGSSWVRPRLRSAGREATMAPPPPAGRPRWGRKRVAPTRRRESAGCGGSSRRRRSPRARGRASRPRRSRSRPTRTRSPRR
jgi:hypothetical protein